MEAPITVGLVLSGIISIVGMIGGYIPLYREWSLDKLSLMVAFGGRYAARCGAVPDDAGGPGAH